LSGPIPARVDSAAKAVLLELIDDAINAGWTLARICGLLELDRARAWRWRHRQVVGTLDDAAPGGNAVHGLLAWEEAEILALFDQWGPVDLSHRKLAHRGSYLGRVWVSPSSVDRVLSRAGLVLPGRPRPPRTAKKPWPEWVRWQPNQLWCWDASHFSGCAASPIVYGIVDVVSRKWVASILCAEATSVQVKVLFLAALEAEGLLEGLEWRLDHPG
jgi:putative transposase